MANVTLSLLVLTTLAVSTICFVSPAMGFYAPFYSPKLAVVPQKLVVASPIVFKPKPIYVKPIVAVKPILAIKPVVISHRVQVVKAAPQVDMAQFLPLALNKLNYYNKAVDLHQEYVKDQAYALIGIVGRKQSQANN
ncbi:hypothetical protein HDE_01959 [Halotydeus destructor]|nr:hypothetical protein HDE_01959 [Halotydeus destructor]